MRDIEAKLHEMLLEVAPYCYGDDEQAKIIAHATSLLGNMERLASTATHGALESHMMDAMLQAIGQLREWNLDSESGFLDGRGLTAEQIIRSASRDTKPETGLNIINEDDLDVFFNQPDYQDPNGYTMDDAAVFLDGDEVHPDRYFFTPGRGRHRSDSQAR